MGDIRVDSISSSVILSYNELQSLSIPSRDFTCYFPDSLHPSNCMDPHGHVVSYVLALSISCCSPKPCFSGIPVRMA